MKGWGRSLVGVGLSFALFAGCGGRTGALDDDLYGDDDPMSVAGRGGAGTSGKAGATSTGGSRPIGGSPPIAGNGGVGFGGTTVGGGAFGGTGAGFGGLPTGGVGGISGSPGGGFAGFGGAPVDCQTCLTQACTSELAQCFQEFGCVAIFSCVAATGCNPSACYSPDNCQGIIDQFGGPNGPSMKGVLEVAACALRSGCQCQ